MDNFFDQDADNTCTSAGCPVHYRNDHQGWGEYGHPYLIKYVGEYAIFSDVGPKQVNPEENLMVGLGALALLLAGVGQEKATEYVDKHTESFTHIYKVGKGAIMDSPDPVEKYHGKPEDVQELHDMAVEMVKVRQEV
jgi:hypothetical protein